MKLIYEGGKFEDDRMKLVPVLSRRVKAVLE